MLCNSIICYYRYVKIDYYPVHSLDYAAVVFAEMTLKKDENQFVEGIMFNKEEGVIMVGNMTSVAEPGKVSMIYCTNKNKRCF